MSNTAPTSIALDWDASNAPGGVTTLATVNSAGPESPVGLAFVVGADAEGNPLTYTISSDETGSLIINPSNTPPTLVLTNPLTPGDYSFTLHATDPGGLYVEQTFTITVTA